MKDVKKMTAAQLRGELAKLGKKWDAFRNGGDEDEGHGGSPGEWMVERMGEIETEQKRRKAVVRGVPKPPPPGTPMCQYPVAYDTAAGVPLERPRACTRAALAGEKFCGGHKGTASRWAPIEVRDGGFCVWCAEPGRSFVADGVTIALCKRHAKSLGRAIREGR